MKDEARERIRVYVNNGGQCPQSLIEREREEKPVWKHVRPHREGGCECKQLLGFSG